MIEGIIGLIYILTCIAGLGFVLHIITKAL